MRYVRELISITSAADQNFLHVGESLKNGRSHSAGRVIPSLSRSFSLSGTYPVPLMMAKLALYCLS